MIITIIINIIVITKTIIIIIIIITSGKEAFKEDLLYQWLSSKSIRIIIMKTEIEIRRKCLSEIKNILYLKKSTISVDDLITGITSESTESITVQSSKKKKG